MSSVTDPPSERSDAAPYRGRFAPSPTGELHFGSLVAAMASFLEARSRNGRWLVRMEDLDRPREVPGAADAILGTLEKLGMSWDEPVLYQSRRGEAYAEALDALQAQGRVYGCGCSRRDIARRARKGPLGPIYPGTCRGGLPAGRRVRALRVRVPEQAIAFQDAHYGRRSRSLAREVGDFVVRRADGIVAYHLAVVVDDAAQGITHVVRGSDLLDCTAPQIHLQRLLGLPMPAYRHIPVAVNAAGEKLSKQTGARAVSDDAPGPLLVAALEFLHQAPPPALATARPAQIWEWAIAHWQPQRLPAGAGAPAPGGGNPTAGLG